jgi:hypothetical protein
MQNIIEPRSFCSFAVAFVFALAVAFASGIERGFIFSGLFFLDPIKKNR